MQDKIKNLIKGALKNLGIEASDIVLEHPADFKMGDHSTNVAMALAKNEKTNPEAMAEKITNEINKNLLSEILKVENKNGFINFYLSDKFFAQSIEEVIEKKENFGKNNSLVSQKTIVEHTDPNPFKEFHIGHLMPNVVGSTIARILAWNGGQVKEACYQGDVGMHVAKAIWAMMKGINIKEAYASGHRAFIENENAKKEIEEINKKIYEKIDKKINEVYEKGREESLTYFETIYERLGTHFDYFLDRKSTRLNSSHQIIS